MSKTKVDNVSVLESVLATPAQREVLLMELSKLASAKNKLQSQSDLYNNDVKSTAEAFGLTKGFVSGVVTTIAAGSVDDVIDELTNKVDLLQVVKDELVN